MKKAKIISAPSSQGGGIPTTVKNTGMSQRASLEEIIINLASCLGAKEIYKSESARGSYFYEVQAPGLSGFQSATNTILELSRLLSKNKTKLSTPE